ncbi:MULTISPECIES: hypothetical protein [Acidobacterium]|nr:MULTISPECIES: hypothetical protein [Acidobacterium]HCT59344.1 hypothetical protein [Acidobacterium sp.]
MWILPILLVGGSGLVWMMYIQFQQYKLRSTKWEDIVSRIQPMHEKGLAMVAQDHLNPQNRELRLEPDDIWQLLGGREGLKRMRKNADLLVNLAAYVQRWNFEEAVIIAERIRQDSMIVKRAVFMIQLHMLLKKASPRVPFHMQQAAASYYLMTQRLLALYETCQYVRYPALAAAL